MYIYITIYIHYIIIYTSIYIYFFPHSDNAHPRLNLLPAAAGRPGELCALRCGIWKLYRRLG